jgi:hypothetical protein
MRISLSLPRIALAALSSLLAVLVFGAAPALAGEFGLQSAEVAAFNQNGTPDLQAGSHPYSLVASFFLNQPEYIPGTPHETKSTGGDLRGVRVELPPGFVGDPEATHRCVPHELEAKDVCPNDTVVGYETLFTLAFEGKVNYWFVPVFNMQPPPGMPAQFAFQLLGVANVWLNVSLRTGGDYGLTVTVPNLPQVERIYGSITTIWGVPAAAVHDPYRGACLETTAGRLLEIPGEPLVNEIPLARYRELALDGTQSLGDCPAGVPASPLLDNPTLCNVPRTGSLSVESWQHPGVASKEIALPELGGCEKLEFSPSIALAPDGSAGSTPTGLNVEQSVPQESLLNSEGLAESDVKGIAVALPSGVQVNPAAADGLGACSEAQFGLHSATAAECPDDSKIGTVEIATPLLPNALSGSVYLASPQNFAGPLENPFGSLVAMYIEVENKVEGVRVKVAGRVSLDPVTGQITATFNEIPQLPYSSLKLRFFGTDRAPLATPGLCGTYQTQSSFEPWSETGTVHPLSSFQIEHGPNGAPCSDPLPFSPTLESGTTNIDAGAFSTLDTTFSREDGQQNLSSVQLHYPAGISGLLSGVKLCAEAQANAGTCGPESEIGETIVSVGLGGDPFSVTGGKVFITEKYEGAPFGLSIVNPAKAGPFVLQEGRPVVVRAKIEVNPLTAALTVTTNSQAQGYAIPHIIDGISLQIKHVYVNVNRPGFTFNPTNCTPSAITGTIDSVEGASSPVSIPFQVTNCASLKFEPTFKVSTSGKTSRADGASLDVKLAYPAGSLGKDANIAKVKVDLPKQLPSRLTTLQKACPAKTFEANPAGCSSASIVGHASAITPLIPVPLTGPAYFVSYGGAKFPELVIVLQGYGVTLDLHGETFISKAGITSSTFHTVPDAPVGSFELTLPEGPDSALAANGNLCKSTLKMPTAFVGQNGAEIHESTEIGVTGCLKHKAKAKGKHHKRARAKPRRSLARKAAPRSRERRGLLAGDMKPALTYPHTSHH